MDATQTRDVEGAVSALKRICSARHYENVEDNVTGSDSSDNTFGHSGILWSIFNI